MDEFKAQIAIDNSATFLNPSEFGAIHKIDGKDAVCILDTDLIEERNKRSYAEYVDGVYHGTILIFIEVTFFEGVIPKKDSVIRVDNRFYLVSKVADNMGVIELTLTINTETGTPM